MDDHSNSDDLDIFGEQVFQTVNAPALILSEVGAILRVNNACERISGYSSDEMTSQHLWDFLCDTNEIEQLKTLFSNSSLETFPTELKTYCRNKSGDRHHITWSNALLRNKNGDPTHLLATGVDITETESAEHQLSESKAFLRSIIDASPVAVITITEKGRILSFSKEAEVTFGLEESKVIGRNVNVLMPEPYRSRHDGFISRYLETGEKRIIGRARQIRALRKNGEEFPAILHVSEFHDGERIFVGFVEDITEQKETERYLEKTQMQLQHAGRIGAMGEIATSIAHELNQPLTAAASLAGAVSLLLKKQSLEESDKTEILELIDDSVGEIRRASEIIRQMRDFVRKRHSSKSLHDVNSIVEEANTIALIGAESEGITVQTNLAGDAGQAHIDRIQIQQVIVNLVRNAVDAMHDSVIKNLTIETARIGEFVEIRVADTGAGIPKDVRARLFDPFVTSKDDGMGVGLSISKSIVDAHQGDIFAEDGDSTGSVFTVRLPAGNHDETADS